jgi:hypothetical protein
MEEIQQEHATQIAILDKEKKQLEEDLDNVQTFKN